MEGIVGLERKSRGRSEGQEAAEWGWGRKIVASKKSVAKMPVEKKQKQED